MGLLTKDFPIARFAELWLEPEVVTLCW